MSQRIKFSDQRWFADLRPTCDIENQLKQQLLAKDEFDYSAKLQQDAMTIYNQKIRKTPVITIKANTTKL
jgi:hypothetical protein